MSANNLKASFYTLGCRLNQAETGLIQNSFRDQGYQITEFGDPADVCVINSCTVTAQADADCRKLVRKVLRKNPDTYVAVVGCYAQTGAEALQKIDGIDLIIGTQEKMRVLDHIVEPSKRAQPELILNRMTRDPFTVKIPVSNLPTTRANVKIQDGCNFMCSFCIVPFARGRARSRAFWDIQREAIEMVAAGYKELVVTGVNIGTYEFEGNRFIDVIKMLLSIPGLERLRISSIEPTTFSTEIFDLMAENEKLCRHIHLPLQSGSDTVLADMKRLYTSREFLDFIEYGARKVPDLMIATDIIIGFPTETDEAFQATVDLLEHSPLVYAHIFNYSTRTGTAAERLKERISPHIKKQRSRILHEISERKKHHFYTRSIGKTLRVLLEEIDENGLWAGYSDNYIKVKVDGAGLQRNQVAEVRIYAVKDGLAFGKAITGKNVRNQKQLNKVAQL